ncbi:MAG TPA: hypothetical protein VF641_11645 [Methylobacterium sp.]
MALIEIRRAALAATACLGLLVATGISAEANDEPGFGGLFQRLFQPAQPAAQPAPAAQAEAPALPGSYARRRAQRADFHRPRPKIRYAALPKAEPLKLQISDRQTPIDMKAGPVAALLKDDTLRPGDIVVLKDGARVFTGEPAKRHTLSDFEPVHRSSLVDRRTRTLLAGMIRPAGALPADAAQAFKARLRTIAPPTVISAVARMETAAVRVIYPSTLGR